MRLNDILSSSTQEQGEMRLFLANIVVRKKISFKTMRINRFATRVTGISAVSQHP
jgi:hypothetical protein